jgi:hypothetical protein
MVSKTQVDVSLICASKMIEACCNLYTKLDLCFDFKTKLLIIESVVKASSVVKLIRSIFDQETANGMDMPITKRTPMG